jgi:hypothetical protein
MGLFKAIGGVVGGFAKKAAAKRNQRRYAADRKKATAEIASLEKNRQKVINPYDNFANLSSMAKDLSGNLSNPYASLSVSTASAEMQIEEADIALANTLDTLRATGAGAGGATALAQAALKSKKGVASSIEQQEVANEKLKAQGRADLEKIKMSEAQRVQGIQMSEAQRLQQADVSGKSFVFGQQESREMQQLDRKQAQITGQAQVAAAASQGAAALYSAGIGAVGQIGSAFAGR